MPDPSSFRLLPIPWILAPFGSLRMVPMKSLLSGLTHMDAPESQMMAKMSLESMAALQATGCCRTTDSDKRHGQLLGQMDGALDGLSSKGTLVTGSTFLRGKVGEMDGVLEGEPEGAFDGSLEGAFNGTFNGASGGAFDGILHRIAGNAFLRSKDGETVGVSEGETEGAFDGTHGHVLRGASVLRGALVAVVVTWKLDMISQ